MWVIIVATLVNMFFFIVIVFFLFFFILSFNNIIFFNLIFFQSHPLTLYYFRNYASYYFYFFYIELYIGLMGFFLFQTLILDLLKVKLCKTNFLWGYPDLKVWQVNLGSLKVFIVILFFNFIL